MKILLTTLNAKYIHLNLAIRLLYDLNKEHPNLDWHEFTIKENKDEIADYCADYDLIAFSCYIWNISQTLVVCEKIKERNPNCKILLGGPEVSYEWEAIIALPAIDYIITGEGEVPFTKFIKNYPNLTTVPSLVRKEDGEIHYNPETEGFDLADYAGLKPYSHDPVEELRNKVLYIETSRGCPYKCEFCLASLDNKVRYLPMDSIKEMLLYLMEHGRTIKFLDRTFNIKKVFTLEVFEFILENHRPDNVFQFEITADIIHPDIIKFIHERVPKGLFRFEIGIQTVNQEANREVQRKQNFEKTKQMVLTLQDKIEMHLDLIVGLPLDYWDDIKYSITEVFKLFPPELQLGFLKFLKGTPMRDKEQHGFVFDPNPPYQIIESKYLSAEELDKIESDMKNFQSLFNSSSDIKNFIKNPTQSINIQNNVINLLADKLGFSKNLKNFFLLLIKKRRIFFVKKISENFLRFCSRKRGEVKASLISSKELSQTELDEINKDLSKTMDSTLIFDYKVDKELIGGLKLQLGSFMIDTSINNKLKKYEQEMIEY